MRQTVKADTGKLAKIEDALSDAVKSDDPIKLQEALDISVKTRDNSFSVSNQLESASDPSSPYDVFASDAYRLVGQAMRDAIKNNSLRCLNYFLMVVPHNFKLHQRCLRDAVNVANVEAVRALLAYTGKLDHDMIVKHMTTVFLDEGDSSPLPILAEKKAKE
jgi:hypothetical protein